MYGNWYLRLCTDTRFFPPHYKFIRAVKNCAIIEDLTNIICCWDCVNPKYIWPIIESIPVRFKAINVGQWYSTGHFTICTLLKLRIKISYSILNAPHDPHSHLTSRPVQGQNYIKFKSRFQFNSMPLTIEQFKVQILYPTHFPKYYLLWYSILIILHTFTNKII